MVLTNPNTTVTLCGIVKWMKRLILLGWKQNKVNHVLISLDTLTVKVIIKPTQIYAHSRSTTLIENSIPRNTRNFMKTKDNQFVQVWMVTKHDYEKYQRILTEYSQKQLCC